METVEQILTRYKEIRERTRGPSIVINRALEFRPKPKPVLLEIETKVKGKEVKLEIKKKEKDPAKSFLANLGGEVRKPKLDEDPVRFQEIIRWVSEKTGYSKAELMSGRRYYDLILARHLVWQIGKKTTSLSYPQMGKLFGGRDHTTVMHAIRKTPTNINDIVKQMLDDLKKQKEECHG